jgi:hypothetical protein
VHAIDQDASISFGSCNEYRSMIGKRAKFLAAVIGVAIAIILLAAFVVVAYPSRRGTEIGISMATVLWMHAQSPASAGNERWYNFTLDVNRTIPLVNLLFEVENQSQVPTSPPTFGLDVINQNMTVAEFNISTHNWTTGGSGSLQAGDWLDVHVTGPSLNGDLLLAVGDGHFSSATSAAFP